MGRLVAWAAILCSLTVACAQDIEGLRTPRSPASQSLGIRWHQGFEARYQWLLTRDYSVFGDQPMQRTLGGDIQLAVLSVGADGVALVQVMFRIDPQYTNGNPVSAVSIIGVGPRGKVTSNPDEQFADLDRFYTVPPLLPPAGSTSGDRWHESYQLPNPVYGNTRDFSVNGQYVRDEGSGFSRAVVIQAHMTDSYDDMAPYERVFGTTPPTGAPEHVEEHLNGKQIVDVTYRFDPARQSLVKSTATFQVDETETFTDAMTGKPVGGKNSYVGTETMTFTRS